MRGILHPPAYFAIATEKPVYFSTRTIIYMHVYKAYG